LQGRLDLVFPACIFWASCLTRDYQKVVQISRCPFVSGRLPIVPVMVPARSVGVWARRLSALDVAPGARRITHGENRPCCAISLIPIAGRFHGGRSLGPISARLRAFRPCGTGRIVGKTYDFFVQVPAGTIIAQNGMRLSPKGQRIQPPDDDIERRPHDKKTLLSIGHVLAQRALAARLCRRAGCYRRHHAQR